MGREALETRSVLDRRPVLRTSRSVFWCLVRWLVLSSVDRVLRSDKSRSKVELGSLIARRAIKLQRSTSVVASRIFSNYIQFVTNCSLFYSVLCNRVDVHRKENIGSVEKSITIYGNPENCTQACKKILEVMQQEAANTTKTP